MSSYVIRKLPPGLVAEAKARARAEGLSFDAYLIQMIAEFAAGTDRAAAGRQGAAARAASLTPEERTNIARQAAQARWQGAGDDDRGNR